MKRQFNITKVIISCIIFFITLNAYAVESCNSNQLTPVLKLIALRASYLHDVALFKYNNQKNVYDAKQEDLILNNMGKIANQLKLNPLALMNYAQIQMDFSKQIEQYWISYWISQKVLPNTEKPKFQLTELRLKIKNVDLRLYPEIEKSLEMLKICKIQNLEPSFNTTLSKAKINTQNLKNLNQILLYALLQIAQ